MKTIKEYQQEFLKLAKELEKDYGTAVRQIYIRTDYERCDIEFVYQNIE